MAEELRYIFFNWSEIVRAIADHRRRNENPLPPGTIVKRELNKDPQVKMNLVIEGDTHGTTNLEFDAAELAAALIRFCLDSSVPLPVRNANKSLQVLGKKLALVVCIGKPPEGFAL